MATHKNFGSAFKAMYRKLQSIQSSLPTALANEGTKFFISNFDMEGFTDVGFQAWKPRENKKSKRKILVKSGRLKRAVNKSVKEKTFKRIVWKIDTTEVPYAKVHNDGEIVYRKAHKRTATIYDSVKVYKTDKNGKIVMRRKKVKVAGSRHNVSASSFKMPRRHFMGKSEFLNRRFRLRIKQAYAKALNN